MNWSTFPLHSAVNEERLIPLFYYTYSGGRHLHRLLLQTRWEARVKTNPQNPQLSPTVYSSRSCVSVVLPSRHNILQNPVISTNVSLRWNIFNLNIFTLRKCANFAYLWHSRNLMVLCFSMRCSCICWDTGWLGYVRKKAKWIWFAILLLWHFAGFVITWTKGRTFSYKGSVTTVFQ